MWTVEFLSCPTEITDIGITNEQLQAVIAKQFY